MASNRKPKNLRRTFATTTALSVFALQSGVGATTVSTDNTVNDVQVASQTNANQDNFIEVDSNYPGVPYFYYWTTGNQVYLNWDYGHVANRPSKIEAVIDKDLSFSNPSYIQVKPKGTSFVPNIDGDFYLRVRFFDSSGNVTHESIRKVIRGASETRDIKGLKYEAAGTGVKISWANFVDGIQSAKIFVEGKLYKDLKGTDIKDNSVIVENVSEGSEIRVSIINGKGLEYNGVVNIKKGTFAQSGLIKLSLSGDGVGINVDLSGTSFKKGQEFIVDVTQKEGNKPVTSGFKVVLGADKGSFVIYPDAGSSFLNTDYVVKITDVSTGNLYTYDYSHNLLELPNFTAISNGGEVIASWDKLESVAQSELIWSTTQDFASYNTIPVDAGKNGVSFETNVKEGKVYLLLTTYDSSGRVISQNVSAVDMGQVASKIDNFKGVYKDNNVVEFSWNKINTNIAKGVIKINDQTLALTPSQIDILNSTNTLTLGGFEKGNKYNVSLYLIDDGGKSYSASVSTIQESASSVDTSEVEIAAPDGIYAKYTLNPGVLTLTLDQSLYNILPTSPIGLTIDGKSIPSINVVYVQDTNSLNITGLIPQKQYKNMVITYKDNTGADKSVTIDSLLIKKGGLLDSFLINAYNKALSRQTQNIDEEGYNYWKNGLLSKNIGLSYFIRNLAYVPEFMNLINSPQDLVTRLYNVLVLRDPDPQGLQFWTSVYNELISKGVSHTEATMKILTDMTTSAEFANLAERLGVNP